MQIKIKLRILFIILIAAVCYGISATIRINPWIPTLIGGCITAVVVIMEISFSRISVRKLIAGGIGLGGGVVVANLLAYPLLLIEPLKLSAPFILLVINLIAAGAGLTIALNKTRELFDLFFYLIGKKSQVVIRGGRKLLDTSVIIDGRIVELCETGFIEGVLVIPQFILTEVQQIADSPSSIKRTRGKRGLDIVNKLQNQGIVPVEIVDKDFPQITEVDSKLLELAKSTGAKILTNDYNLKKVAKIQDVLVLNINELATSLKPVLLPGERLRINILKEGENPNQGVAYLDDGTMVVVEGGKRHIGRETEVTVTSVLQTTTGKMIFTEIKGENERKKVEKRRNKPKS